MSEMESTVIESKLEGSIAQYLEGHLQNLNQISQEILELQYKDYPQLLQSFSKLDRDLAFRDVKRTLIYLIESLEFNVPNSFSHYIGWLQSLLVYRGVPKDTLLQSLEYLEEVLKRILPVSYHKKLENYIRLGKEKTKEPYDGEETVLKEGTKYYDLARHYLDLVLKNQKNELIELVMTKLEEGVPAEDIFLQVITPVQYEIGRLWQINKISVAQEHYASSLSQLVISKIYFHIFTPQKKEKSLIATCISGELHEMGLRLMTDIFELHGWDAYYLGANTPTPDLIQIIELQHHDLLCISATMFQNIPLVVSLINNVRKSKNPNIKIMVGGFPFMVNKNLWKEVGADGMGKDIESALQIADELIKKGS
ncbi:hypothetical protein NEF87_003106 [Candidatus Lokiarchaeum ossiferum]|uniref:B12-binding domain-containing protein n=1 Tax=Candidatus Lokiarchaeum ossiferum TaxID=2951803 RepID=A0ABY6HTS9_9ARCH|nr:hypothetical protein NEF87_003106 [Candidatus Lokiarchaeum sp. B-35]